jgi:hypothetical protein
MNITHATVRGLTVARLHSIKERRDPHEELLAKLDALEQAIRSLQGVSEQHKSVGEKAVGELKDSTRGTSRSAMIQLMMAWLRSQGYWP